LNGSDPEIINSLKKGLGVAVSLDGYGDNHDFVRRNEGLFLRVERSIKLLRTNMIPVNIVTTLGIHNFGDVEPLMSFAKLNTSKLHLRPAIMTGSATANGVISEGIHHKLLKYLDDPNVRNGFLATKRIIPESRHYGCGLRERISVDYSGVLYPCVMDRSNYYMNLRQYTQEALVNQLQEITQKNLSENLSCIDCSINKEKIVCGGFCKFSRSYKGKAKTSCVHMQSRDQL
jgi:radical SAM protein with 4Fe4S-binding SPASM domain